MEPTAPYVVVTGAVGAGASTLAERLVAQWSAIPFLEETIQDTNPFFARAQVEPRRWSLANQAHFLTASVERHRRLRNLFEAHPESVVIEDRTPFEHTGAYVDAYAALGLLPDDEATLLRQLGADLAPHFLAPAVLIYREMTQEQLTERVQSRARPGESIDTDRLVAIHTAFESFVSSWDRSAVVRIPAHVDVLTDDGFETALAAIVDVWDPPLTQ